MSLCLSKKKSSLNAWMFLFKFRLTWRIGLLKLSSAGSGSALTFDPTLAGSSTHPWLVLSVNESKQRKWTSCLNLSADILWFYTSELEFHTRKNWSDQSIWWSFILKSAAVDKRCPGQVQVLWALGVQYFTQGHVDRNKYQHNQTPECSDCKLFRSSLNSYRTDHW